MSVEASAFGLRTLRIALIGAFIVAAWSIPASAAGWLEMNAHLSGSRYDAVVPPCDTPSALSKIQSRFTSKEYRFWESDLQIVEFDRIREIAFRPWAADTIPRRFCRGRALVSDGRWRPVYYSIIEDGGMIGGTWGVQWCVVGLDRNLTYNPRCKMARP